MNKELFVSTTPHETKVGITEDDQLAEIYLERENEYTLAGSIYKGRVTRVLPGMQSAFVDIGLERDAFLYVSDFMDLEQQDEDLDEAIPANRPEDVRPRNGGDGGGPAISHDGQLSVTSDVSGGSGEPLAASEASGNTSSGARDFRGRRRRRGRRGETGRGERPERSEIRTEPRTEIRSEPGIEPRSSETRTNESRNDGRNERFNRGDRFGRGTSDSRFQRPTPAARTGGDYDYGPPPGYQPMVLPGESISKYQRQGQTAATVQSAPVETRAEAPVSAAVVANFPEDEPIFAASSAASSAANLAANSAANAPANVAESVSEPLHGQHEHAVEADRVEEIEEPTSATAVVASSRSEVAEFRSVSAPVTESQSETKAVPGIERFEEDEEDEEDDDEPEVLEIVETSATHLTHAPTRDVSPVVTQGAMEEQEIEEEEAELVSYGEEPGDDEGFEETEEETRAAGEVFSGAPEVAAEQVSVGEVSVNGEAVPEAVLEAEEREAEELELEEAQAEAEALLEAEAIGDGTVDASAEVRGPAPEARLLQRTQRRGPERGPDRGGDRGRGRRGGRRFRSRENTVVPQISELLKEGQEVLIQIAKEPIAKKGARITSHIALPGRFLVFMPTVNHTGVSRKIASEEERQRLKRIIQSERENGGGGFIVRTAAAGATDEELRADIRFLKNLWNEIKTRSDSSKAPALIYHDLNVVERVLRDQVSSDFSVIWVDTEQEYERIVRFANRFQPGLVKRVKLYTKETPLYDQFGLNEEINKALKSKVWLKSGGYIVINQTEALVAIDVNTGKYVGKTARLEDTIVKTNVDAIKEIVRQVRLRDLGGIIIIDFIDMDERRNRQKVMQALEEALRLDRAPSKVLQFNDFGLVAITRKRVKQSLERTIGTPCPYCQSTGFVKSVSTICNEVYVEMRKISSHLEHSDVMLRVNPEVAKALKLNNAKLLAEMEELTKKTIIVKSDPALHQEQFDIH